VKKVNETKALNRCSVPIGKESDGGGSIATGFSSHKLLSIRLILRNITLLKA